MAATKPASFMAAVKQYRLEHGCGEKEAVNKCVDLYPELHAAMRGGDSQTPSYPLLGKTPTTFMDAARGYVNKYDVELAEGVKIAAANYPQLHAKLRLGEPQD